MSNQLTRPRLRDPNAVLHRQRRVFPWGSSVVSDPPVPPDVPPTNDFSYWLNGLPFTDPSNNDDFTFWIDGLNF